MLIPSSRIARWYLRLLPAYPPKLWTNPAPLERAVREYDSEQSNDADAFLPHFPALRFEGRDVLDLGCGCAGRSVRFKELGAGSVTAVEIMPDMIAEARAFVQHRGVDITVVEGAAEAIPCATNSFDVVISYDVFEHVDDLAAALRECHRVLRPGGALHLVFPPIHHPTGGSHLHGYLSRSPAPTVLFSRGALLIAVAEIERDRGQEPVTFRPTHYLPSVNGTTIRQFKQYIAAIPFSRREVALQPLRSNRLRYLNPLFALAGRLPWAREVATDRIVATLTK